MSGKHGEWKRGIKYFEIQWIIIYSLHLLYKWSHAMRIQNPTSVYNYVKDGSKLLESTIRFLICA